MNLCPIKQIFVFIIRIEESIVFFFEGESIVLKAYRFIFLIQNLCFSLFYNSLAFVLRKLA